MALQVVKAAKAAGLSLKQTFDDYQAAEKSSERRGYARCIEDCCLM